MSVCNAVVAIILCCVIGQSPSRADDTAEAIPLLTKAINHLHALNSLSADITVSYPGERELAGHIQCLNCADLYRGGWLGSPRGVRIDKDDSDAG